MRLLLVSNPPVGQLPGAFLDSVHEARIHIAELTVNVLQRRRRCQQRRQLTGAQLIRLYCHQTYENV